MPKELCLRTHRLNKLNKLGHTVITRSQRSVIACLLEGNEVPVLASYGSFNVITANGAPSAVGVEVVSIIVTRCVDVRNMLVYRTTRLIKVTDFDVLYAKVFSYLINPM